jgi:hypothetical protein
MVHSGLIPVLIIALLQVANAQGERPNTESADVSSNPGNDLSVENQLTESNIQYGKFDVTRTMADLIDPATIESLSDGISADEDVTWRMYFPDSYTPSEPAGLLVYVSPTPKGQMPRGWQPVFDEQNLIFISADRSGNRTSTKRRMLFAALAPYVVSDKYEIDASRIYVSGFSGGGKVASLAAIHFANLFAGAMYICGAESWPNVRPALLSEAKQNR